MKHVLKNYLEHICGKEFVEQDKPLSELTSFKIGGPAKFFVRAQNKATLLRLVSALNFIEENFFVIGGGFNILAGDGGYDGVIIKCDFDEILDNGPFIYADAGAKMGDVLEFAKDKNLSGLEWAIGIPGTVGGMVYMNAGAFGGEIADVLVCVDVLVDDQVVNINAQDLKLGYRKSIFQKQKDWIILGAYFYLRKGFKEAIEKTQNIYLKKRTTSQPTDMPNAGSTFRRPKPTFYVGSTIQSLGLQGYTVGGAQISTKHAGFIVNNGGATCRDVKKIIKHVKRCVFEKFGERLRPEYVTLGHDAPRKIQRDAGRDKQGL